MHFRSNGKLLLTGEYLVMRGAKALAIPLSKGQSLEIKATDNDGHPNLLWFAFGPHELWFKTSFELPSLDIIGTTDRERSARLQLILLTLQQLNPAIFDGRYSYQFKTRLDFEPEWGFGSSSTLIANLSRWADVDPFTLLNLSIGGSGYDIACALTEKPLHFQLKTMRPIIYTVDFEPVFRDKLFFVYQGKKQDSAAEIIRFNQKTGENDLGDAINSVNEITEQATITTSFREFCSLMDKHERLIGNLLERPPLKTVFPGFEGHIKSLGAWGGDFFLAMTEQSFTGLTDYFAARGIHTVFKYNDLIR